LAGRIVIWSIKHADAIPGCSALWSSLTSSDIAVVSQLNRNCSKVLIVVMVVALVVTTSYYSSCCCYLLLLIVVVAVVLVRVVSRKLFLFFQKFPE